MHLTLSPAYGRDYKSAVAARIDLANDKDFLVTDTSSAWDRKPVNLKQLREAGYRLVYVRYAGLTRATRIDISKNLE